MRIALVLKLFWVGVSGASCQPPAEFLQLISIAAWEHWLVFCLPKIFDPEFFDRYLIINIMRELLAV